MPYRKPSTPPRPARVKIADVAAAAGVHLSTVSRVLRGDQSSRVSPDVAARIRAVAQEMGYSANPLAAGMRTRSTRSVGFIVHDVSDPVYPPILRGIERRMGESGYMVMLGNTGYDTAAEMVMLEQMAARMVDGVILGTTQRTDPVVDRALQIGLPVVSVLRRTETGLCSAVINDCAAGMVMLTHAVVDFGHRDIAVIGAPQNLSTACDRQRGVITALADRGVPLSDDRTAFAPKMDVEHGRAAMQSLLAACARPPEAVMCVNDLLAIGALQACRAVGLHCPQDISITGYNDIPLLDMLAPPLSSVAMDLPRIGNAAAALLLAHLAEPAMPSRIETIAPELRLRASLGDRREMGEKLVPIAAPDRPSSGQAVSDCPRRRK